MYTPTYLLFFNSAEDAAEKMSPISSIESFADIVSTYGNSREAGVIEGFAKNAKELADEFDDKYKINLFTPLLKQLKKDKNISDVKLNRPLKNFPRSAYTKELGDDAEIFSLDFKRDGRDYSIPIIVRKPSFLKMQTAKAFTLGTSELLPLYGLDTQAINRFSQVCPF